MSKQVRPPAEMDSVARLSTHLSGHPSWIAGIGLSACFLAFALCGCGTTSTAAASSQTKPAVQHQVDLTWSAPGTSPVEVIGYNVYRAPQGNSSYQRLNSSTDTETVYLDSLVTSGASYSYFVTSVDTYGAESAPSNSVDVTIP